MSVAVVAKRPANKPEGPTIKAVLAEAQRLRERAEIVRDNDPWAKPYVPSDRLAYQLASQLGPEGAIAELRRRSDERDDEYRKESERSKRSREALQQHHAAADEERERMLKPLTLGQRLDEALAALSLVSTAQAASLEPSVSAGKPDAHAPQPVENRVGSFADRALRLVVEIESELPRTRRRITRRAA